MQRRASAILIVGNARQPAGHAFARDAGFAYWTIGLLHRGRSEIRSGDAVALLSGGDMLLIRPHVAYQVRLPEGGEESWALLDPPTAWTELLAWPEAIPGISIIPAAGAQAMAGQAAFREAVQWWAGGSPRQAELALNALERCLLLRSLDRPGGAWSDLHPGVRQALAYLAGVPGEKVTVAALARRSRMSVSHFAHTFTAQTGEAPLAWLEGRRIAQAKHLLLTTDLPVKRIARDCGFADGEHLSRRFRARTGRSPRAWRLSPDGG